MIAQEQLEKIAKVYGGILILGSLPESPAAQFGLRYGDILTTVNGVRVRSVADFFTARAVDRENMRLVIVREGREIELTLSLTGSKRSVNDVREYLQNGRRLTEKPRSLPS